MSKNHLRTQKIYKHRKIIARVTIFLFAALAVFISYFKIFTIFGISSLIIAVVIGAIVGNTMLTYTTLLKKSGTLGFATREILRLGIILYGFRITFTDIAHVGFSGILFAFLMVFSTFFIGFFVSLFFGLDKKSAVLISAGSSICGAAAVMASESIIKGGANRVAIAVCGVVVFGSLGMLTYPTLYKMGVFDLDMRQMGFLMGGTLHEVAHAVAAGSFLGGEASDMSVIVKMLRVLMLVPFLLMLGLFSKFFGSTHHQKNFAKSVPWFAIFFLVATAVGSFFPLDFRNFIIPYINFVDNFLLTMAMFALGVTIQKNILANSGFKPFLIAIILVFWLVGFGYFLTKFLV